MMERTPNMIFRAIFPKDKMIEIPCVSVLSGIRTLAGSAADFEGASERKSAFRTKLVLPFF